MIATKPAEQSSHLTDQIAQSLDAGIASTQRTAKKALDNVVQPVENMLNEAVPRAESYIRNEPLKAMLIAGTVGAALMAIASLVGRSRRRPPATPPQ